MSEFNSFNETVRNSESASNGAATGMASSTVWEFLLQGLSVGDIAARLKLDLERLYDMISHVVDCLVVEMERMRECWYLLGLSQLKRVQAAAWDAWTRSWQPRSRTTRKKVRDAKGEREEEVTLTEESRGEPRYLMLFQKCIHDVAKWIEKYATRPGKPAKVQADPREALNQLIQVAMQRKAAAGH